MIKYEPLEIKIVITQQGKVLAEKTKELNGELLTLKEGVFNMEHQIADLGSKAVREVFDNANNE